MTAPLIRATALRYLLAEASVTKFYRPKTHVDCDECVIVRHELKGAGPDPQPARLRRKSKSRELRLCYRHADAWRVDSGDLGELGGAA